MLSTFESFDVTRRNADGTSTPLAVITVKVYDADSNAALANLTTDSEGVVAPEVLSVPVGTRVRFRVENQQGLAGSLTQITI